MKSTFLSALAAFAGLALPLAYGAVANDRSACEGQDMGSRLVACTRLIETGKLVPKDRANAYNNRGMAHVMLGRLDRALNDFDSALALDSTLAVVYLNRGYANAFSARFDASERDFASAMKAKPDWAEPYVGRSINRVLRGSLDGAVTDLTTAIRLDRNDAQKYVSRGGIYRQQGKIPEAIADFKAALKIDPKDELARKHLEELLGAINGMQNCPSQLLNISADLLPVLKSRPGHNFIAWQWRQRKSPNRRYACLTK